MSDDHPLRLVLEELKQQRQGLAEVNTTLRGLRSDLQGLQVALVQHAHDESERLGRFEAVLSSHSSRLKTLERSIIPPPRINGE